MPETWTIVHIMREGGREPGWRQMLQHVPRVGEKMRFEDHCEPALIGRHEGVLLLVAPLWEVIDVVHHLLCEHNSVGEHEPRHSVWLVVRPVQGEVAPA